ncbi:MAG: hypothetical protein ACI4E1_12985 [Lachnospira sp.]
MVALSVGTEIAFQLVKFIIMLALIVVAWIIGSTIRKKVDAGKAAKLEQVSADGAEAEAVVANEE